MKRDCMNLNDTFINTVIYNEKLYLCMNDVLDLTPNIKLDDIDDFIKVNVGIIFIKYYLIDVLQERDKLYLV